MNNKTHDGLKLWGRLQIFEGDELVFDDKNLIVNTGKIAVLNMLSADSTNYISELAIGNGGTSSPATSDVALTSSIESKVFSSSVIDTVNRIIEFRVAFNSGSYAPGAFSPEEVSEAALMMVDGTMFSRKVFTARPFLIADLVALTFIWSVGVA